MTSQIDTEQATGGRGHVEKWLDSWVGRLMLVLVGLIAAALFVYWAVPEIWQFIAARPELGWWVIGLAYLSFAAKLGYRCVVLSTQYAWEDAPGVGVLVEAIVRIVLTAVLYYSIYLGLERLGSIGMLFPFSYDFPSRDDQVSLVVTAFVAGVFAGIMVLLYQVHATHTPNDADEDAEHGSDLIDVRTAP